MIRSSSRIFLDKEDVRHNWDYLHRFFPGVRISSVVKGNAYGHGISQYVPLAQQCGVTHFSVFNAHEAYTVLQVAEPGTTIMIMGDMDDNDIVWAIDHDIEFYIFDMVRLQRVIQFAATMGKPAKVHIEVETGMHRTGFERTEINSITGLLQKHCRELVFKGLCTHFAGAENLSNHPRIEKQKAVFREILSVFQDEGIHPEIIHVSCSAVAIRMPDMHYDMLRIGILQYGFWPNAETLAEFAGKEHLEKSPLKRIINWESHVMSIKKVPADSYIGYGSSFYAHYPMTFAIVPVGYAYGFARALSNMGVVLINGIRAPVAGMVNMNCIAVDITHHENVKNGDPVILIGEQGDHEISVASFGEMSNQLNYELLTRLPLDIPRSSR